MEAFKLLFLQIQIYATKFIRPIEKLYREEEQEEQGEQGKKSKLEGSIC
jgi:hypothetical protein